MSDNIAVTPGSGAEVAAELISGAYLQRVKMVIGDLDSDGGDVASDNPMPISGPVTVSGVATATNQTTANSSLSTIATNTGNIPALGQALAAASVPIVLTSSQLTTLTPPAAITGYSTSSNQTNASQKTQIVDSSGSVIASTSNALNVNISSGNPTTIAVTQGTAANLNATVVGTGTFAVQAAQSTASNLKTQATGAGTAGTADSGVLTVQGIASMTPIAENQTQINGNTISAGVGATGTGTQRVVIADNAGRTLLSASGTFSSSGNNTLIAASGSNKNKIYAFTLSSVSATAVTCIFEDGASGTALWQVVLQSPGSVTVGAALAVTPPAFLFANSAINTLISLNLSASVSVNYSVAYFQDAT